MSVDENGLVAFLRPMPASQARALAALRLRFAGVVTAISPAPLYSA